MLGHTQTFCWAKQKQRTPRSKKPIKKVGKYTAKWFKTRSEWFNNHLPDNGYYQCHYCGEFLLPRETTLDHIKPRGSHPELRFEQTNLVPCCYLCNKKKGSLNYEKFVNSNS